MRGVAGGGGGRGWGGDIHYATYRHGHSVGCESQLLNPTPPNLKPTPLNLKTDAGYHVEHSLSSPLS